MLSSPLPSTRTPPSTYTSSIHLNAQCSLTPSLTCCAHVRLAPGGVSSVQFTNLSTSSPPSSPELTGPASGVPSSGGGEGDSAGAGEVVHKSEYFSSCGRKPTQLNVVPRLAWPSVSSLTSRGSSLNITQRALHAPPCVALSLLISISTSIDSGGSPSPAAHKYSVDPGPHLCTLTRAGLEGVNYNEVERGVYI
jgi:hypothetical protein